MKSYKDSVPLAKRAEDSHRILTRYPNHVPVIVECSGELSSILIKKKYLISMDATASYLLSIIRNKITLRKEQAVFMFCDNCMLCLSDTMGVLYDKYTKKHNLKYGDDNFYYITLTYENTFG
jgi:hypothetical protein